MLHLTSILKNKLRLLLELFRAWQRQNRQNPPQCCPPVAYTSMDVEFPPEAQPLTAHKTISAEIPALHSADDPPRHGDSLASKEVKTLVHCDLPRLRSKAVVENACRPHPIDSTLMDEANDRNRWGE